MNKPKTATVSERAADTIRVYVPTSRRDVAQASVALAKVALLAGGWTYRPVVGGWIAPNGQAITEPPTSTSSLSVWTRHRQLRQYLVALSEELLASGEQAVLLVVLHSGGPTITFTLS